MEENQQNPAAPEKESENPEKDEFVIGKGFLVDETAYEITRETVAKNQGKKKNLIKNVIWVLSIIIVSVGITFGVIYVGADYLGIGFGRGEDCVVEISQGTPTSGIAAQLKECGAVRCPLVFRMYSKLKHFDAKYKYGVYTFNNESGYSSLAEMLMTEGAKAQSVKVKIPEAATVDDIATLLEENGVCTKKAFINEVQHGEFDYDFIKDIPSEKVYYRLEGYLFPETYDFYCYDSDECAHLAVDRMLKTLNERIDDNMRNAIKSSKYGFHELMTMSSVVELEAGGFKEEANNVAAVFFNRLKSPDYKRLESSPTKKYPYGDGRYDTYQCEGLPVGPLCSPSLSAIRATLNPTENFDYYYFVTDAKMKFYYNKTLADHNSTIARLKKENNWIGDK